MTELVCWILLPIGLIIAFCLVILIWQLWPWWKTYKGFKKIFEGKV